MREINVGTMGDTKYYVGTSGWQYSDWKSRFYPIGLTEADELSYYANSFNTVEVNNTFYRHPKGSTVSTWANRVGKDFRFSIKANRYFTHLKRLKVDSDFILRLESMARNLVPIESKLGCLLLQLPPNFTKDLDRLESTLLAFRSYFRAPFAIEFRNSSWFSPEIFKFLKSYGVASVINDAPKLNWPSNRYITTDWLYIRLHGDSELYKSNYSVDQLMAWKDFIKSSGCAKVFCYFNNDFRSRATANALSLSRMLSR